MLKYKTFALFIFFVSMSVVNTFAQCAMCRATLETNVSNGSQEQLASTLNFGIMYLFAAPYLLVATVGFVWYKQSRKTKEQK